MTSSTDRILLVDDDQALLDGLLRFHRKQFDLTTACGGAEALELLEREGPFAVVVSDYKMPGMDGIAFLAKVRERAPDSIRVMLTGNADLDSAIQAVNEGRIFRFLTKPCETGVFTSCLSAAQEQYRLRQTERFLLEQTVRGCIEVLAEVLALSKPDAFGRSLRVRRTVREMAARLKLPDAWQVETAALLSQIGFVAIPLDIVERLATGQELSPKHAEVLERHPAIARELLGKIPRLERVAQMVEHQRIRHADVARARLTPAVALGSQILSAALDLDELLTLGAGRADALRALRGKEGAHDSRLLELLGSIDLSAPRTAARALAVRDLRLGMTLDQDVHGAGGVLVVARGNRITQGLLARLRNYAELGSIAEPVRVLVPDPARSAPRAQAG